MLRWFLMPLVLAIAASSGATPVLIQDESGTRPIDRSTVLLGPELVEFIAPVVPDTLWEALSDTTLMLFLYVNHEGGVDSTAYLEGEPLLVGSATEAALEWRFEPARTVDSIAVDVSIAVPFIFCPSCPERSLVRRFGLWKKLKVPDEVQE